MINEKELKITPDKDGNLVLYLGITYQDKIYGGQIRFNNEFLQKDKEDMLKEFNRQGENLVLSAKRKIRELLNGKETKNKEALKSITKECSN